MDLVLSVVRCPDAAVPATRRVTGGELTIGRGEGNDWVLADPNRHLSKHHCTIAFRSGRWMVTDQSTNGTFLDRGGEPIGRGASAPLRDGSRLTLGEYEIEVRVEERGGASTGLGAGFSGGAGNPFDDDPFAPPPPPSTPFGNDPFGRDPYAMQPPSQPVPTDPFGGIGGPGGGEGGSLLPDDFDPLSDIQGGDRLSDPSWTNSGSRPDHTPASSDAFVPPPVVQNAIPDDWDLEISPPPPPPAVELPSGSAAGEQHPLPAFGFDPMNAIPRATAAPEGTLPRQRDASPADDVFERPRSPTPVPTTPLPIPTIQPAARQQAAAPEMATPGRAAPETGAGGDDAALLAAFLAGAGLPDLVRRSTVPPEKLMHGLGAAFRAFVEGLREVLITRASIKSEFRIEQTIIAARGNNPLKFSPSVEDAIAAMLGEARGAFMDAETAVRDSLDDVKHHEMATMAAMQAGLRAVLAAIEPASLREEAEAAGGLSLVPAQRRARAFDLYEARFAALSRDIDNNTDGAFARAFARAYEAAGGRG
ncbi:type VI secretion system-associated FHA domain protein TagH [Elioraea sp.]|uniref:type VI secretion system-associated FHA domain protein TagH n=1 Tax=Elioraea sp. TaxID=2185103 RepID=UPI0025C48BAA|nr:type VI secretion system-associated FHA domain protein TagH [Elioraea sp.]